MEIPTQRNTGQPPSYSYHNLTYGAWSPKAQLSKVLQKPYIMEYNLAAIQKVLLLCIICLRTPETLKPRQKSNIQTRFTILSTYTCIFVNGSSLFTPPNAIIGWSSGKSLHLSAISIGEGRRVSRTTWYNWSLWLRKEGGTVRLEKYKQQLLKKMQRRHSSNTDNFPPERSRSQTVGSESSVDEGGVFESLKPEASSSQQLFSGLTGLQSASVTATPFQSGLVLGSSTSGGEVFIQMTPPREEGTLHPEGIPYHHHRQHHHHFHHGHHRSSLLHVTGDRHGNAEDSSDEPGTPAPALSELKAVISWLQKGLPFILILLAKVCFQHKLGIAVCIGMASTFAYANSTVKHQVSLREKRSVLVVLWILAFLAGNTFYLYYTFNSQQLYNSVIFLKPNLDGLEFFDLIWIVGITDFVLKYITISLKCLVLILPKIVLAVKSKSKFYLLIEELSQLFRSLLPIQLWYKYIVGEDPSSSYFVGGVLIILYSLCKSFDICGRIEGVRKAVKILCSSQNCGTRATSQQCTEAGDICAICQAEFREPVTLMCQHVFCEECICLWFDKERNCPLCRSVVVETLRCWKDGTTSAHFQVY